jgi:LTXXQ motif family protein
MQHRIEAMISAVAIVRSPLEWVYSLLDDEQKARFNALAEDERRSAAANNPKRSLGESCGAAQSATLEWPTSEIENRLHPNNTQRAALKALQDASSQGSRHAQSRMPARRPGYAAGAARCDWQEARYYAGSRQTGARCAWGFLRYTERRTKGAIRGDRAKTNGARRLDLNFVG